MKKDDNPNLITGYNESMENLDRILWNQSTVDGNLLHLLQELAARQYQSLADGTVKLRSNNENN